MDGKYSMVNSGDQEEKDDFGVGAGSPEQQYARKQPLLPAANDKDSDNKHIRSPGQDIVYPQCLSHPPNDNLTLSVCSFLCCCWPVGLSAIIASSTFQVELF